MADLLPVLKEQASQYEAWTEAAARPDGNLTPSRWPSTGCKPAGSSCSSLCCSGCTSPAATCRGDDRPSHRRRRELGRPPPAAAPDRLGPRPHRRRPHQGQLHTPASSSPTASSATSRGSTSPAPTGPATTRSDRRLTTEPAYRRFPRARLRAFLEAIENSFRAETGQPQVERAGFPIEHILPQKWKDHWPVEIPGGRAGAPGARPPPRQPDSAHQVLNSKVSNGPWASKRKALMEHNTIKLTGRLLDRPTATGTRTDRRANGHAHRQRCSRSGRSRRPRRQGRRPADQGPGLGRDQAPHRGRPAIRRGQADRDPPRLRGR